MKRVIRAIQLLAMTMALLCASLASGCSSSAQPPDIEIHGAWDVIRLGEAAAANFSLAVNSDIKVVANGSSTSIDDLKNGLCDAVILGRELTAEELAGLQDHVIAYDAVCIIIDANAYNGCTYTNVYKTDGLKDLTFADLVAIGSYWLRSANLKWQWNGEYYTWAPLVDPNTGWRETDPVTGNPIYGWVRTPKTLSFCFNLLPGKYDTQTSLYDALGISEQEVSNTWNGSFTSPNLAYEEEIVAYAYKDVTAVTAFQLGFASRRVALLALKHAPVQVISINGIDPVEEPQAIYNGTYPLSRKIHLLTTDNASQNINDFVDYMLSPWGQAVIESAGYLPLAQNESIR